MAFASDTSVSVERTRAEIETTLARYGATSFAYATTPQMAQIAFQAHGRMIVFRLPMPRRDEKRFTHTAAKGLVRTQDESFRAWEQACRSRWRALLLAIKAKLEAVECGISSFEQEFLAFIMVPGDGRTIGDAMVPQLEQMYQERKMPNLLLGMGGSA